MIRCPAVVAASLMLTACFEIEHSVKLREDLSGELSTSVTVDLQEASHYDLWNGGMRQDEGVPSMEGFCGSLAEENARLTTLLPAGTRLVDNTCTTAGGKGVARRRYTFDHLSKLPSLLALGVGGFGGIRLHVREDGPTWLLSAAGDDFGVLANLQELAPRDEGEEPLAKAYGVRGSFTVSAAPEIAQHNAHRADGKTLVWEYDSMHPPAGPPEILVRLGKKGKA